MPNPFTERPTSCLKIAERVAWPECDRQISNCTNGTNLLMADHWPEDHESVLL